MEIFINYGEFYSICLEEMERIFPKRDQEPSNPTSLIEGRTDYEDYVARLAKMEQKKVVGIFSEKIDLQKLPDVVKTEVL